MAKIVKRSIRRIRLKPIAIVSMTFALLISLISTYFINTRNADLMVKIQTMNEELNELQSQNRSLNIEIQGLENKDRVYEIAATADMNQIADNIISLVGE